MIIRKGASTTGHRTVQVGNLIYMSGATASDRTVSMKGQTEQIFERLDGFLESVNATKKDVVFATVYVTRMDLKSEMDNAWSDYFEKDHMPGRATVGVTDLGKDCLIEMQFIAAK